MSRIREKSREQRRERDADVRHEAQRVRAGRAEAWRLHNEELAARSAVTA